jgi:hypothetical protein
MDINGLSFRASRAGRSISLYRLTTDDVDIRLVY